MAINRGREASLQRGDGRGVTRRDFLADTATALAVLRTGPMLAGQGRVELDGNAMEKGFMLPPDWSKPWVYWWWLNGNVSKQGITRDLEEMKRQGINGVLIFQAGGGRTPQGVQFLSPPWHELFQYTLQEATRLGMVASVNLCDGWDSGGPWITRDLANKKLVYSEVQVDGEQKLSLNLPLPPVVDDFYRDVAIVAVPEKPSRPVTPAAVTASSTLEGYVGEWNFPPQDAVDADPETFWSSAKTPPSPTDPAWLVFKYDESFAASEIYVLPGPENGPRECELQASEDGKLFSPVCRFHMENKTGQRVDFQLVRAKYFRLMMMSAYGAPVQVAEALLLRKGDEPYLRRGIKWWWFKSGNRGFWDYPRQGPAALAEEYNDEGNYDCRSSAVVNLTNLLGADGHLQWEVPQGRWTILRFGYTLEGQRTRSASEGGHVGYEANMLDSAAIETHFTNTAAPMLGDVSSTGTKVLRYFHIDSYELGADVRGQQPTWSKHFRKEFEQRRGYDLLPYLPALARRVVDSRETTDRFLFDFRWTIGDLMAERFWKRFGELSHQHGMRIESETGYGTYPYPHIDGLRCAGNNDVPMGEFWYGTDIMSQFDPWGNVIRTVATAGHIYGRSIVQAESFTSWKHWQEYPQALKPVGDQAFLDGLNRMVLHQYTLQPLLNMKPGWEYGAGTHFDRNITWWEQARAFFHYLARCQYLLQQGDFVADALYFYGEGATKFVPSPEYLRPTLPPGYNFDAINSEQLLRALSVDHGRLVLPSGMSYRVLVMPEDGVVSPQVLRKIRKLVAAGGLVVGPKPQRAPGLQGYPNWDSKVKTLGEEIWGECDGEKLQARNFGQGRIFCGRSLSQVFREQGITPDFAYQSRQNGASLGFVHRATDTSEWYFVSNRRDRNAQAECIFRVTGKQPELWDPINGKTRPASAFRQVDGRTHMPLEFAPYGCLFVVFRRPIGRNVAGTARRNFPVYVGSQVLSRPWRVTFDPKWGGPAHAEFAELVSWTKRSEEGIKYYSGTATYRQSFDLGGALRGRQTRLALDLGEVKYVAQVRLNGKDLGVLWTKPFRVEITDAAKPSGNLLEVDVVNLWPNRIIGDAALPREKRYTHTNISYKEDTPLLESGLLGPVRIQLIQSP